MKSIVITPKDSKELKFIAELLEKMGISSTVLSEKEKEDAGLLMLMKDADENDVVSRKEIVDKLQN
jgi:hypothetical protein